MNGIRGQGVGMRRVHKRGMGDWGGWREEEGERGAKDREKRRWERGQ